MYKQGEIYFFNLDPTKGNEERKTRPCIIISNNEYNKFFNTVIIIPISSANKYKKEIRFKKSPLFVSINKEKIDGTALLQHLRTIDPKYRITGSIKGRLTQKEINDICDKLKQFF